MHNSVKIIIVFFVRFVKRKITAPPIFCNKKEQKPANVRAKSVNKAM